jgi:PAS domain S-box-containing protein
MHDMEMNDKTSSAAARWRETLKVFETVPDLYLIFSPDFEVLTVSNAYLETFGVSRVQIEGKHIAHLSPEFPGAPANAFKNLLLAADRVIASKMPEDMPIRSYEVGKTATGAPDIRFLKGSNTPVLNPDGELIYIIHKIMDVTALVQYNRELKQVQARLKDESRRLKEAQSTGHIGSFEWSPSMGSLYCSDEMFRIYGLTPRAEGIGIDEILSFSHPDDLQKVKEAIRGLIEDRKPIDYVSRILLNNGETRYIKSIGYTTQDDTGAIVRVYGTAQDITEAVRRNEMILAGEELLRRAEEAGNTGGYEVKLENMELRFSDGMFRILGYEPNAFTPTLDFLSSISYPGDSEKVMGIIQEAVEKKKSYEYFRRIYTPKGELRYIFSKGNVVCNGNGQPVKIFAVAHDITARMRAEEQLAKAHDALQESRDLLQSVFDNSLIGLSVLRAVRNADNEIEDFEITLVSKELERQTGRQDLVGKWYVKEYPGIKKSGLFDVMLTVMETGTPRHIEYFYEHDGFNTWFSSTFTKMDDALVASNLDVTPVRTAAEQIRKMEERQKMEIFKTAISIQEEERRQFSENLRNGIGQLLYAVKVNLNNVVANKDNADLAAFDQAKENTDAILKEAIQETRRIAHQMTPAILEDFGLQESIRDLCRQFRTTLPIETTFKGLNGRLDRYLEVSVYRMIQELITNSVKHSNASSGRISLEVGSSHITLLVEDDGVGFNPDVVKANGLGLLTLTNKVKLLSGAIDIKTNRGTRVHIKIPLKAL